MQFDRETKSLWNIVRLVERGEFHLIDEEANSNEPDYQFIIDNSIPVNPIFLAKQNIVIGSNLVRGLKNFMEEQSGPYLRKVQDFPITLITIKDYEEKDLEKITKSIKMN